MGDVNEPRRIGGWLLLLSRILLIWQPVSLSLTAPDALAALHIRGTPLALVLLWRMVVAAVAVAAGLALSHARPGALGLARTSLVLSALTDVFIYTTSFVPNNRVPGDTPLYVAASLLFYGGCLVYLLVSKRVRETFAE